MGQKENPGTAQGSVGRQQTERWLFRVIEYLQLHSMDERKTLIITSCKDEPCLLHPIDDSYRKSIALSVLMNYEGHRTRR
jgi:hypothetical protein